MASMLQMSVPKCRPNSRLQIVSFPLFAASPPMCYRVSMIDETDAYPTQEELRHAMDKAVRRGLMKANGDGTFSITDDGKECVEEFLLTPDTIH
jgi:hypothetical protein